MSPGDELLAAVVAGDARILFAGHLRKVGILVATLFFPGVVGYVAFINPRFFWLYEELDTDAPLLLKMIAVAMLLLPLRAAVVLVSRTPLVVVDAEGLSIPGVLGGRQRVTWKDIELSFSDDATRMTLKSEQLTLKSRKRFRVERLRPESRTDSKSGR